MLSSIWISTMATIAKPANRADVLLEALSFALLRLRFFQWKICSSIPLTDILSDWALLIMGGRPDLGNTKLPW